MTEIIEFEDSHQEQAIEQLLSGLGQGNTVAVYEALEKLGVHHDGELYEKVGSMARNLHESLTDFRRSLSAENVTMNNTTIPDATSKLEHVIQMTFDAADKTLGLVEEQNDVLFETRKNLDKNIEDLEGRETDLLPQEQLFLTLLREERKRTESALTYNQQILMAQEFQDLTGQALRKVIRLVQDLEGNLISLIQLFGAEQSLEEDEIPVEEEQALDETKVEQDEADAILKSFGF